MGNKKDIRILHIITKLAVGGAQYNTLISTRDISKMGYHSDILTGPEYPPEGDLFDLADQWGLNVMTVPHLKRDISPVSDFLALLEIRKVIAEGDYDIVHTHGSKARFLGRIAAAALKGIKIVQTAHGWPFWDSQTAFKRWIYIRMERLGFYKADATVVVSKRDILKATRNGIGCETDYRLIRSGVELAPFKAERDSGALARKELGLEPNAQVVGSVMRFCREKAPDVFVNVAAEILAVRPETRFVMVGDGPLWNETRALIEEMELSGSFLLPGSRNDIEKILPAFNVFLITSRTEGLPRTLLEALACGVPVVSTDVGGIGELLKDGRNGILCSDSNIHCLKEGVLRILSDPDHTSELLSEVDDDLEPFTAGRMVEDLYSLYTELITEGMRIVFLCDNEPINIPQAVISIIRARPGHRFSIIELPGHGSIKKPMRNFQRYLGLYGPIKFPLQLLRFSAFKLSAMLNLPTPIPHSLRQVSRRIEAEFTQLNRINTSDSLEYIRGLNPDIIISIACPQILKRKVLSIPSRGAWNVHSSILPKNRGMLPSFWSLYHKDQPGVTIHKMVRKLDDGGILIQETLRASIYNASLHQLIERSKRLASRLVCEALDVIELGDYQLLPNLEKDATFHTFPSYKDVERFRELGGKITGSRAKRTDIVLSFDMEEWFQTAAARRSHPPETWDSQEGIIQDATETILNLLMDYDSKATFFVLGWVALRYPDILKKIANHGHELAYHGFNHIELQHLSRKEFASNLDDFLRIMKELSLPPPSGFRAPSFSVKPETPWIVDELSSRKFTYDSSVYPILKMRYGFPMAPRKPFMLRTEHSSILELPLASFCFSGLKLPAAGGAYLRFYPGFLHRLMLRLLVREGLTPVLYFHPWEIDPKNVSPSMNSFQRLRQHHNTGANTVRKLQKILCRHRGITLQEAAERTDGDSLESFRLDREDRPNREDSGG